MIMHRNALKCQILVSFLLLLITPFNSLTVKETKISPDRNADRANICNYYNTSYTLSQRQSSKKSVQKYSQMTDAQIQKLLFQNNYSSPSKLTILSTLPHMISLVILLSLVPALFCCCTWPQKYPLCKKLRKPEAQMYSKVQLKWPAYASLILYLLMCIGAILALVQAPMIVNKYNDVGCKKAALFDDLLNGRMSNQVPGRFFVGLQPFRNELGTFNTSKLTTFFSDSSSALSTAHQVRTKQVLVQTSTESTYASYSDSVYTNAFSADGSTYFPVTSAFKQMHLGPSTDSSRILGNIKTKIGVIFSQVNGALDTMISAWNGLSSTTQTGVRNQIISTTSSIQSLKTKLEIYLGQISKSFYNNSFYNQIYSILTVFYGVIFGFALLGLIGTILLTFCTVVRTRLIMYFTCGFLVFFAVAGFCFLIFLAFMHPQMNQICSYADKRLVSGQSTKKILSSMGYPDYADKISECMQDGSGKILNTLNTSFSNNFDNINVIAQGTLKFNDKIPSFNSAKIEQPFNEGETVVSKVKNALVWDINVISAINHVKKVVEKSYAVGTCTPTTRVNGDVWMPSFSLYSCPPGKSKMAPCSNLASQVTCPLGCYEILNQIQSPSGDPLYVTSLASRYGSSACNYFQYIKNLHEGWNMIKSAKMDTVTTSLGSLKTLVDDYSTRTNSAKATLNSFKTTLQTNLESMTNLTSGSFNGMNCKTIGQSIWDFRDSYCIGLIQSVSYNIVCLCLICYATLLLSCSVTLAGTRHFKHLQKMQMHVGYKGTPISLSDTRLVDK